MSRTLIISLLVSSLAAADTTEVSRSSIVETSKKHKVAQYARSLVGRRPLAGAAVSATYGHVTNRPHEWGRGPLSFTKRFGSAMAHYAVKDGIERGVGAALHEEQKNYVRADRPGFMPKFKSAAENTFWVKHRNSDKRYPAYGRFAGDFGSGLISRLWQPARLHTVASGLSTGGISLGIDFGINLAREYMPSHR